MEALCFSVWEPFAWGPWGK